MDGYAHVARNRNNTCGIASFAYFPILTTTPTIIQKGWMQKNCDFNNDLISVNGQISNRTTLQNCINTCNSISICSSWVFVDNGRTYATCTFKTGRVDRLLSKAGQLCGISERFTTTTTTTTTTRTTCISF
jgi:hypothetical protein